MATTGATFPEKEQGQDVALLYSQTTQDGYRLHSETFDYSMYSESKAKKVGTLIHALDEFEAEYNRAYGMGRGIDPMETAPKQSAQIPSRELLAAIRVRLWDSLGGIFPDLNAPYSDAQFYKTMVSLPRRFAPLGVSVGVGVYASQLGGVPYDVLVKFSDFRPIVNKEKLSRSYFGHEINTYSLKVGSPLGERGEMRSVGESATAKFGNFFEYVDSDALLLTAWRRVRMEGDMRLKQYEARFGQIPSQEPYRNDYIVNTAIIDLVTSTPEPTPDECLESVRTHELGHILNHQDDAFQRSFVYKHDDPMAYSSQRLHRDSHDELDGLLTDLRYGDDRASLLTFFSNLLSDHERITPTHYYGARWIYTELAVLISKDPVKYGVTLTNASRYSVDEQILLALPGMLKSKPDALDRAWEDLWHLHRTRFSEMLYARTTPAMTVTPDQHQTPQESKKDRSPSLAHVLIAGVGVFAGLLAAYQAKRYSEKVRQERAAFESKIVSIREVLKGCKDGERLFQDLQLDLTGRQLDGERREHAYGKIVEIARESSRVRKILQSLKELIGKE